MKKIIMACIGIFLLSINFNGLYAHKSLTTPPYKPSNPCPANNSININVDTNLAWDGGDADICESVYYSIYFGTCPNPPFLTQIGPYPASQTRITYNLYKLNYNTKYYWRIDAIDSYGYTTTGDIWAFTTADDHPPYQPSNPHPPNGASNVDVNTILTWQGGDPDGDTVFYDVYFGTNSNPPIVAIEQTSNMYNPGTLSPNTRYYWRIDAKDSYGYTVTGETWTFVTKAINNPPNKPDKPFGPTSGMIGAYYSYSSSTIDPDGDMLYYLFDWGDGTTSGWVGPYYSGDAVTLSHAWAVQGVYPIRVKAKDEHGMESVWSDALPVSMPKSHLFIKIIEKINSITLQIVGREILLLHMQ